MKRNILVALAICSTIAGCGTRAPDQSDSAQPVVEPTEVVVPAEPVASETATVPSSPEDILGKPKAWTVVLETGQGYTQEATLTLYPGLRGTDTERMTSGWQAVGGVGENACLNANPSNDMVTNYELRTENSYFVFGTLSMANTTEGFSPADIMWQWTAGTGQGGWLAGPGDEEIDTVAVLMGLGYGSGPVCDGATGGGFMMKPNWDGQNQWGPVPAVIAVDGVYTPEHPNGNMKNIKAVTIGLGAFGTGVTINGSKKSRITLPLPAK